MLYALGHSKYAKVFVSFAASSRQTATSQVLVKLLTGLEQLKHTQKVHSAMLSSILRKLKQEPLFALPELPDDIKFPLNSTTEVDALEAKLKNASTKKLIVSAFMFYLHFLNCSTCI